MSKSLTPRETEVLRCLARGLANKQVACCLGIKYQTVKNHVYSIMHKLNCRSRVQAIMIAIQGGVIVVDDIELSDGGA